MCVLGELLIVTPKCWANIYVHVTCSLCCFAHKVCMGLSCIVSNCDCFLFLQMYTNALVQRASMMALHGEMEKCRTCFTKALAIDPNCADVYIYRARVSE